MVRASVVLSVDIGIRNLGLCVLSRDPDKPRDMLGYNIKLWDVYNTIDDENNLCSSLTKTMKKCSKKGSYLEDGSYFCKTHYKSTFKKTPPKPVKKKTIKSMLLQDIISQFLKKLNSIIEDNLEIFNIVDKICIELQPKINPKMKMISHVLFGKMVEYYNTIDRKISIRFVPASKKLKCYTGPMIGGHRKNSYSKRKWLAVQYSTWFIEEKFHPDEKSKWSESYCKDTKKRDDMADVLLMCINEFKF